MRFGTPNKKAMRRLALLALSLFMAAIAGGGYWLNREMKRPSAHQSAQKINTIEPRSSTGVIVRAPASGRDSRAQVAGGALDETRRARQEFQGRRLRVQVADHAARSDQQNWARGEVAPAALHDP